MTKPLQVYVYVHTHWDREWYRTFQQYRLRLIEVVDDILEQLDNDSLDYFTLDGQAIVIDDYLEVRPENKDKLINYIRQGTIEVGPWYVLPDEFLVSGESLIHNLYLGHKISRQYGETTKVGYLPDTFGHSVDIPSILKGFNINNAMLWRGLNMPHTEFIWYSQNKSAAKTYHLIEGYYTYMFEAEERFNIEQKDKLIREFIEKAKAKTTLDYILMPIGGDHRPAPANIKQQIKEINAYQNDYKLIPTTLSQFIEKFVQENIKDSFQQELRDCTTTYILPAVYSSRLYLKQHNAGLTNKINSIIEPLSCFCNARELDKFNYPDSEYLWKMLIENHPHDSICGCSVDEVHTEMEQRYSSLHQACDELINRAKLTLIQTVPEGKTGIYNCSNFTYTGPVFLNSYQEPQKSITTQSIRAFEDYHPRIYSDIEISLPATKIVPQKEMLIWAENIPPHSLKIADNARPKYPVIQKNNSLNNGLIDIQVNKNSLTINDIETGRTYANLNQIIDRVDAGDSYNFGPVKGDQPINATIVKQQVKEAGPLRGILELTYEIDIHEGLNETRKTPTEKKIKHLITCQVILTANSKLVEFDLQWANKSENHLLQVKFPTGTDIFTTLVENHFCAIERHFDPDYNLYDHIPAPKLKELKTNTAPMQRFVQANNIALFAEGLPEYEVYKEDLYLTILRATGYISIEHPATRGAYAGPELYTPGNQCLRINRARYAFHPATDNQNLYRIAESFMGCTIAVPGESKSDLPEDLLKSPVFWNNSNIIATSYTYDSSTCGIRIRMLNISGELQSVTLSSELNIKDITEINFLNQLVCEPFTKIQLNFEPYALKSYLIKFNR
jgi:alpha-mannosidase